MLFTLFFLFVLDKENSQNTQMESITPIGILKEVTKRVEISRTVMFVQVYYLNIHRLIFDGLKFWVSYLCNIMLESNLEVQILHPLILYF